jgi:hypothetical protein
MLWWYDETASVWRPIGSASGGTGAGGAPSYAAAPMQLGLLAAAEEGPTGAFYTFKIDKTISVPINLRILDMKTGAVVRKRQTVGLANVDANKAFNRTVTMYLPLDALQAQVISPKEAPEFYATIDDDANKTAIAQVLKAAGADSAKVITLSLSSQIPNLTESRVEAPDTFLTKTFGPGKNKTALAYYEAVDPFNEKTTFSNWLEMNGFTSNGVAQAEDAKTVFFNACDLGFGRSMHLKMTKASDGQTNLAFYVSNFPSAVDANANRDEIATVAMDYVPHPKFQKRMTAFYVFPKGKNQQRLTSADLDGKGAKFVPNLCMICHGGSKEKLDNVGTEKNPSGDVLARFLPFDLNSYTYGANNGPLSQSAQAAMFKTLNQGVLLTAPTPATLTLVQGWYGSGGGGFSFVPPGWTNTPGNANVKSAYASAFAISCRTCHVSRFDASLAFPSFADLNEKSGDVDYLVYDLPKKEAEPMPNAFRTFTLFWGSEGANTAGVVTPQKPPPDQTLLLQSVLGLKGPRPAAP